ncbi:MAG: hypothetical protein PHE26_07965 [Syntrophomonadaceae bacterium]|nr:hypothetical protein [Syntrophomonadaceae bacterium]
MDSEGKLYIKRYPILLKHLTCLVRKQEQSGAERWMNKITGKMNGKMIIRWKKWLKLDLNNYWAIKLIW